jgi:hypothetical protein
MAGGITIIVVSVFLVFCSPQGLEGLTWVEAVSVPRGEYKRGGNNNGEDKVERNPLFLEGK